MRTLLVFAAAVLFVSIPLHAQSGAAGWPGTFFSGYERTVHGGGFIYHSPDPSVTSPMLVRSADSADYIEWSTERVPDNFRGEDVCFVWMFGINVTTDGHLFSLYVNGQKLLDSISGLDLYFDGNSKILEPYHWGMQLLKGIRQTGESSGHSYSNG